MISPDLVKFSVLLLLDQILEDSLDIVLHRGQ